MYQDNRSQFRLGAVGKKFIQPPPSISLNAERRGLPAAETESQQKRVDQNPFKKGPKLHLFKKNRRLKTSSSTREGEEQKTANG